MKNIFIKTGLTILTGTLLLACNDRLDVTPDSTVDQSLALETSSDVEALLVGAYSELGDGDIYGGNLLRDSELLGDSGEVFWDGTFEGPDEIYRKRMLANNEQADVTWTDAYEVINIANNVLANLEVVDEADRARIEGEARFIRGTVYFELVRLFARAWNDGSPASNLGVPLVITPTIVIDEASFSGRATVEQVYTQILEDLQQAVAVLPEENGFFATKGAATGMLSRVYLMQERYVEAAAAADSVISSDVYALNASYAAAFNNGSNTPEDIFAMQITSQDGTNNMTTFFAAPAFTGRGDIYIEDSHLALYEPEDERLALFYEDEDLGGFRTGKWNNQFGNVNIIRLAEMYLTRAEANFRAGTNVGATPLADINTIRERAGLDPLAALTIEQILLERRLELAFEGQLLHDLKRTERSVGDLTFNSPRLVFPIPRREVDANPGLQGQQNEGY